jgi:hypothetical protein
MRLDFVPQGDEIDQRNLAEEVERILTELLQDARARGFDVSPYLQRLADAGVALPKKPKLSKHPTN